MIKDYISLVSKNIRKRGIRSWLTMIGIFIGIAAVVSLIGLGEGLRNAISAQFGFLGGDYLSIQGGGLTGFGPPGTGVINPLTEENVEEIGKISGVDYSIGRTIKSTNVEFRDETEFITIGSMPSGDERGEVERILNVEAQKGRLLKDGDNNRVVIGANIAEDSFGRKVRVGDRFTIKNKDFEVVGIMKKKGNILLDNIMLMNNEPMNDILEIDDEVSIIVAIIKSSDEMAPAKADIEKYLRKERDVGEGEEDFVVQSPEKILEQLNSTLFVVQLFVYIIASISIVVGGIGISNTMYTAVVERTKEIGIMKSIGAKNSDIFKLFLLESGSLGMVGGGVGVIIGSVGALSLAFLGSLFFGSGLIQAHLSPQLIFGALAFSFVIGSFAGVMPAVNASKLKPVDALRYSK